MKRSLLTLLLFLTCGAVFAQGTDRYAPFQLGFFPPLSTQGNMASQYTNGASLNLLAGISFNERAFTLSALTSVIKNDASGFQMAGLSNHVGNDGRGFLLGGLLNTVGNDYRGFQMGGIANVTRGHMNGLQMGGVVNLAGTMKGWQMGGVGNIAGDVNGAQMGGVFNVAHNVHGVQMGGLFNVARKVHGAQFSALLNIAESNDYPVALINIIRDGEMSIGVTYDMAGSSVLAFRSGSRVMYGILGVGYNHKSKDEEFVMQGGIGAHININNWFRINNEIKSSYMTSFNGTYVSNQSYSLMPAFRVIPRLEIFGGPSINYMFSDNLDNTKIFPSHSLWKKHTQKHLKQLFVGFEVGTQFIF